MTGKKVNMLTVLRRAPNNKEGDAMWVCRCDCENIKIIKGSHIRSGKTKSCGCLQKKVAKAMLAATHPIVNFMDGKYNKRLYKTYHSMKARCFNKHNSEYDRYGGRGITICQDWLNSFVSFYKWAMGNGYADNLTIDRIDLDGDYSPSNCRWITQAEQNRNTSRIRWIEKNDGTKITSAEAARIAGLSRATVARWCRVDGIRTLQGILQRADEVHSRHSKGVKNSGEKILLAETER